MKETIEEKVEKYLNEAKPYGKAQEALYKNVQDKLKSGETIELSELTKNNKDFHNIHFGKIQKAAQALDKKGLIKFHAPSKIEKI